MITLTFNHCWDCPYMITTCYVRSIEEIQICMDCCSWFEKERYDAFPVCLTDDEAKHIPEWCPLREENRDE